MQILVTGSTGNVGREVVKDLVQHGAPVRAAVVRSDQSEVEGAPAVRFDFRDANTWPAALEGVRKVFLMRPPAMGDVEATLIPFLQQAQRAGVAQVVFLSLIGAQNNKRVPHYAVEQTILQSGLPYTFVRPGFFMQNATGAYRDDIRFDNRLFVPAGKGRLSFIDVRDIGAVAGKALREEGHAGKAYAITGSESLNFFEVAAILTQVLGRPITYARPSTGAYKQHLQRQGYPDDYIAVMSGIYFPVRMGWAGATTDEFAALMGRAPIRFEQFARDFASVWAEPGAAERADYAARLAAIPPRPQPGLLARLRARLSGPGRIGV